jgi:hypothetical protein
MGLIQVGYNLKVTDSGKHTSLLRCGRIKWHLDDTYKDFSHNDFTYKINKWGIAY